MNWHEDEYDYRPRPPRRRGMRWWGFGLVALVVVVGLIGVGWLVVGEPPVPRNEVGCATSADAAAPRHIIFLIDRSDPLDQRQLEDVREEARAILNTLAKDERLTVYAVNPDTGERPAELFYLCRPVDTPNSRFELAIEELIGNRKERMEEFEQARADLEEKLAGLTEGDGLQSTSLLRDIAAIASYRVFSRYKRVEFVIYSDMLENSTLISQYKDKETFEDFRKRVKPLYRVPKLADVVVRVLYRLDDSYVEHQTPEHQQFWSSFFEASGVKSSDITFEPTL